MKDIEMVPKSWVHEADGDAKQPTGMQRLKEIPTLGWAAAGIVALAVMGIVLGARYSRA